MFLCGNKVDLISDLESKGRDLHELQTQEGLEQFAEEHGFCGAMRTSAKLDIMITPMMAALTK